MEHQNAQTGQQGTGPSNAVVSAAFSGGDGSVVPAAGCAGAGAAMVGGGGASAGAAEGVCVAAAGGSSSQTARGRRGNRRHTQQQINAMEAYFEDHPHPKEMQRNELARRIGLDPAQVKFWFQNKRTQLRMKNEREQKEALQSENDLLRAIKRECMEALEQKSCPEFSVGSSQQSMEEHNLLLENIRLREEKEKLKSTLLKVMVGQNSQKKTTTIVQAHDLSIISPNSQKLTLSTQNPGIIPIQNPQNLPIMFQNPQNIPILPEANNTSASPVYQALGRVSTVITSSEDWLKSINVPIPREFRQAIVELVVSAVEELKVMAMAAEPLWNHSSADGLTCKLNEVEYFETYPGTCEASCHKARILLNPKQLLNILMDVNEWSYMFSAIVSRARIVEILYVGENYNRALQLMAAEYYIPTPLVPNRASFFARYCTKHSEGVWAVVDVSLDNVLPTPGITTCHKRPSGCVIQEMSDGTLLITWIEHVYADHSGVGTMCKRLLHSGLGFGAKRWVSTLRRQCQRLVTASSSNVQSTDFDNLLMSSPEGRRRLLKLSERMVNNFLSGITGPKDGNWTPLHWNFSHDVKLMSTRVVDDPGLPNGTLLSVATSFALSLAPHMVFDFFRDHKSRKKWDIFANAKDYEPVCRISFGEETSNCVSVFRVPVRRPEHMLVLQESWSNPVASHIVFAPTELGSIDVLLSGGDPNCIPLLPSGFTILPDGPSFRTKGSVGTLLTVSFQVLINKSPTAAINYEAVSKVVQFLRCNCDKIKLALSELS